MRDIEFYIEKAKENLGITSNRQLSKHLNLGPAAITYWTKKGTTPTDESMLKLAAAAGINEAQALIDLHVWRTADNAEAQKIYKNILKKISIVSGVVIGASLLTVKGAHASPDDILNTAKPLYDWLSNIYYGK